MLKYDVVSVGTVPVRAGTNPVHQYFLSRLITSEGQFHQYFQEDCVFGRTPEGLGFNPFFSKPL